MPEGRSASDRPLRNRPDLSRLHGVGKGAPPPLRFRTAPRAPGGQTTEAAGDSIRPGELQGDARGRGPRPEKGPAGKGRVDESAEARGAGRDEDDGGEVEAPVDDEDGG